MATTQAQPSSTANTIHALVGSSFNLAESFGPGGNASVDLGGDNPYLKMTSCNSEESMNSQTCTLQVTFLAVKAGNTEVTFLISPRGDEPITARVTYLIQILFPNSN